MPHSAAAAYKVQHFAVYHWFICTSTLAAQDTMGTRPRTHLPRSPASSGGLSGCLWAPRLTPIITHSTISNPRAPHYSLAQVARQLRRLERLLAADDLASAAVEGDEVALPDLVAVDAGHLVVLVHLGDGRGKVPYTRSEHTQACGHAETPLAGHALRARGQRRLGAFSSRMGRTHSRHSSAHEPQSQTWYNPTICPPLANQPLLDYATVATRTLRAGQPAGACCGSWSRRRTATPVGLQFYFPSHHYLLLLALLVLCFPPLFPPSNSGTAPPHLQVGAPRDARLAPATCHHSRVGGHAAQLAQHALGAGSRESVEGSREERGVYA